MKHSWVDAGALAIMAALFTASPSAQSTTCAVTVAPQSPFTAPAPYPAQAPPSGFWHGNERFWTMLAGDGTWAGLPRNERGFRQKVFWWYPGFDGRMEGRPDLKVFGRRLDGPESFVSGPATNAHHEDFGGWTILTGIDVPTRGCWELTGTYRGESVTFVVRITD